MDLDLDELERLAKVATPGPWTWSDFGGDIVRSRESGDRKPGDPVESLDSEFLFEKCKSADGGVVHQYDKLNDDSVIQLVNQSDSHGDDWVIKPRSEEDLDFIAACSPDVILALIERVRKAEK